MPFLVGDIRVSDEVAQQEKNISRENDRGNALRHPVIEARTREVCDISYHTHTPARTISTTETAMTILEPRLPPSRVSPTPASMTR
ncbi:hypothetical protein D3C78_1749260 [compost metagenome]